MAANTDPIFSRVADIQFSSGYLTTASTNPDITGGTPYLIFTSDATNGGFVSRLRLRAVPGLTTTATVCRLWINNGGTTASASNSILWDELTLPSITGSSNSATPNFEFPLNFALPASYRLYATLGSSSTNGFAATVIGGKY